MVFLSNKPESTCNRLLCFSPKCCYCFENQKKSHHGTYHLPQILQYFEAQNVECYVDPLVPRWHIYAGKKEKTKRRFHEESGCFA